MGSFDRKTAGTMKRILNGVGIVLGTLLLMVIGLFLSRVIWLQLHSHREDMPQGWFHGYLQLRIDNHASSVSNNVPSFSISAKGRTQSHWYWRTPTNFSYPRIELLVGGDPSKELVKLELPSLTYQRGSESGTLTSALLAQWIAEDNAQDSNAQLERETAWVVGFLQRTHSGTAPSPKHAGIYIEDGSFGIPPGVRATLYHWRLGGGIWWLDWVVLVGTIPGVWWIVRRRRSSLRQSPKPEVE